MATIYIIRHCEFAMTSKINAFISAMAISHVGWHYYMFQEL